MVSNIRTIEDLYHDLAISPDRMTNEQVAKLEEWISTYVSTDRISTETNLAIRLADYEKLLTEYFNNLIGSTDVLYILQTAINQGFNKILDQITPSAQQINSAPYALSLVLLNGYVDTLKTLLLKGLMPPSMDSDILHKTLALPVIHTQQLIHRKEQIFNFIVQKWPQLLFVINDQGNNILHSMAENNFYQLITNYSSSLEKRAHIQNNQGFYPVTCAILNGGYESVTALLKIKGVSNLQDSNQRLPVHYAANYSDARVIVRCLAADPSVLNAKDSQGKTPLHLACIAGNNDAAQALIEAGADMTQVDIFNRLSLHYAAMANNQALISLLLPALDPNLLSATDEKGKTALDYATDPTVQILLRHNASDSARH